MEIICEIKQTKSGVELIQVWCSCTIILYKRYPFFFHQCVEDTPIDKPSIRVPLNFHMSFQIRVQYSPLLTWRKNSFNCAFHFRVNLLFFWFYLLNRTLFWKILHKTEIMWFFPPKFLAIKFQNMLGFEQRKIIRGKITFTVFCIWYRFFFWETRKKNNS